MTDIKIDSSAVQSIVAKAIMEGMSQDDRDAVMLQAVEALVTPREIPGSYRGEKGPTPLQLAFNTATHQAAHDVVREMVNEGDLKDRIRELVKEKVVDALTSEHSPLNQAIGSAVGDVVQKFLGKANQW